MRVLIADDHDLVREAVAILLTQGGMDEVVTAGSLDGALAAVASGPRPDLVLLDYAMPGMGGLDGLRRMIAATGGVPVALFSGSVTPDLAEAAIRAGAAGFVPKTLAPRSLIAAVHLMIAGEVFAPFGLMRNDEGPARFGLTGREREVLRGICEGKSNKEIALDLDLQEVTVKLHVKSLTRKLDARNRTHAAMIARDNELV